MGAVDLAVLLLIGVAANATLACTLCSFRTPPRPRPLDQYKLPKMGAITLENRPQFCQAAKRLPVDEGCRQEFERIFCSTDLLTDALSGCRATAKTHLADEDQCSECAHQKADNLWVLKWFDSLGKPPAGITEGNYYWLGDYELCTAMRHDNTFNGQYCRVEIEVPDAGVESGCPQTDPLSIVLGACFPSSCSAAQLTNISQLYLPYEFKIECESESSWSTVTYMLIAIAIIWLVPQFVATVQSGDIDSIMACFSIPENAKRAVSTRRESTHLHCVHGLEFVVNFAIISGMVYNLMLPYIENVAFSFEGVSSVWQHIVNNYSYHVDGLLALSAFYTTYLLYGEVESLKHAFDYIVMRFFRFWPAYVTCVLFMAVVFPGISSGPMWIHTDTVSRCETAWWKNILFINNWFNVTDTCVDFGYVISLEAQYYALLVLVIYLSTSHVFLAQLAAYAAIVASIVVNFYRAYAYALPPAPMLTLEPVAVEKTVQLFDMLLLSFAARISPYCMGFVFGIGCATASDELRQLGLRYNPHKVLALVCLVCVAYPLFGAFGYSAHAARSPFFEAAYAALHRPMYAFALLSLIYLCHHGALGWLDAILGWRVFAPLSKLTWIALVVAEPVILYFFSSLNKPAYATHWSTVYTAISAAFLSYFIALLIDIFVARPIRYLMYREQKHRYARAHATAAA
ncbi:unnamed protein product [Caenorhabditis bovis]|uniref:Nose resistant-to-fluoxetine protein N-terminal domain-containing protein n=1 Tax=Caenorhabditis bovis TaxID=2654633 RepID=A0A8S1EHV9_9PELO|nr:unnamed protein product [Caenorhabditis bovis]